MTQRVTIVTGSSGGIGTALVEHFSAAGDTVIGLDLESGFDLTDPAACQTEVERIQGEYGRIDVLVNNAGVGATGTIVDADPDDWQRVFAVNVFGLANISRAVLPVMREQGDGAIVNISSIAAQVGLTDRAVYSASKGAVLGLTRAMAADEVRHGIRVNCVCPATVDGPWVRRIIDAESDPDATYQRLRERQPLGRLVAAEEVAGAVAYLASPAAFMTGQALSLDGGSVGIRLVDGS